GAPWPRAAVCDDPSLAHARAPGAPAPIEQGGAASAPICDPMAELVCRAEAPADEAPVRPARAIAAEGRILDLPLDGFGPAVVAVPLGAQPPRPVVVAAHGNYDRPEWQCAEWADIVGDRAFVLCPRGVARPDSPRGGEQRFTYRDGAALEREVAVGLAALARRFGADAATDGELVWGGFSWGAILGVGIARGAPARYPRLVLVEGGHDPWTAAAAHAYAAAGGKRVLFVCGSMGCVHAAVPPAARLAASGVAIKIELADGMGHGYGGRASRLVASDLAWLLE
ncbi:MAG: hypothetical protein IT373_30590, partial [Polyangiaceae bacterium]|nr:hypothetical protein [Polyangiaceae bacterium]